MSADCAFPSRDNDRDGIWMLKQPILPIVHMVQFLYLTGPFRNVAPILDELCEPIKTETATYENPAELLRPYLPVMENFEVLKNKQHRLRRSFPAIVDEELRPLSRIAAVQLWISQQILTMELERINSLLCESCNCVICCVGPDRGLTPGPAKNMKQHFFEIPLTDKEIDLFDLPRIDNAQSRQRSANSEPPLTRDNKPFYETRPGLYHWRNGWSLILPRHAACLHLDEEKGACRIYPQRPEVCRRPQIFPYALEKQTGRRESGAEQDFFVAKEKLLAVWDCPYVRARKEEVAAYAEMCGLEPVFMENKG